MSSLQFDNFFFFCAFMMQNLNTVAVFAAVNFNTMLLHVLFCVGV